MARNPGPIVSPAKLATYTEPVQVIMGYVGNGSSKFFDINHNFNTKAVTISLNSSAGERGEVICDVLHLSNNTIRLRFNTAPYANQYEYVVRGGLAYTSGPGHSDLAPPPLQAVPMLGPEGNVQVFEPKEA